MTLRHSLSRGRVRGKIIGFLPKESLLRSLQIFSRDRLGPRTDSRRCVHSRELESAQQTGERSRNLHLGCGSPVGVLCASGGRSGSFLASANWLARDRLHGGKRGFPHWLFCAPQRGLPSRGSFVGLSVGAQNRALAFDGCRNLVFRRTAEHHCAGGWTHDCRRRHRAHLQSATVKPGRSQKGDGLCF